MSTGPRYISLTPPPDNGCDGCRERKNVRAFCPAHRPADGPSCWICGDRGWAIHGPVGRFGPCNHGGR